MVKPKTQEIEKATQLENLEKLLLLLSEKANYTWQHAFRLSSEQLAYLEKVILFLRTRKNQS